MIRPSSGDHQSGMEAAELELPALARLAPVTRPSDARVTDIVRAHHDFIWRLLRRLGVPLNNVDDATQQVFCVAARRIEDISPGSERSFLFGTAVRVAADSQRSYHRHEQLDDGLDERADASPNPEEQLESRRRRELLDRILNALPIELRTVLVLFELEQLSKPEVAELLGIPEGTAFSRLRRAREEFKVCARRVLLRSAHGKAES
ncbi:MAG TPA: sigma-70 family RNA polymerase sigma factor [Polyangiaceae bacterium]